MAKQDVIPVVTRPVRPELCDEILEVIAEQMIEIKLPLRRYRVTLRHALLSELGSISHALLIAYGIYKLDAEPTRRVLRLSQNQLSSTIGRLCALGLLDSEGLLTARGRWLAMLIEQAHGRSVSLWLCEAGNNEMIFVLNSEEAGLAADVDSADCISATDWHARRSTIAAGNIERLRLRRYTKGLLQACFPEAAQSVDDGSTAIGDWDLEVARIDPADCCYLTVPVKADAFVAGTGEAVTLVSEILALRETYSMPSKVPAGVAFAVPSESSYVYSHRLQRTIAAEELPKGPVHDKPQGAFHALPTAAEQSKAAETLLLAASNTLAEASTPMLSRSLSFSSRSEMCGIDWRTLMRHAGVMTGVVALGMQP